MASIRTERYRLAEVLFVTSVPALWGFPILADWLARLLPFMNARLASAPLIGIVTPAVVLGALATVVSPLVLRLAGTHVEPKRAASAVLMCAALYALCSIAGLIEGFFITSWDWLLPVVIAFLVLSATIAAAFFASIVQAMRRGAVVGITVWMVRATGAVAAVAGSIGLYSALWGYHDPRVMNLSPLAVVSVATTGLLYGLGVWFMGRIVSGPDWNGVVGGVEQALQPDASRAGR